jgi:hypothetical protein
MKILFVVNFFHEWMAVALLFLTNKDPAKRPLQGGNI